MVTFSDDFNRANGALGANWQTTVATPSSIISNAMVGGAQSQAGIRYKTATATDDQFCQATYFAGSNTGVALAMSAFTATATLQSGQHYGFRQNTTTGFPGLVLKASGVTSLTLLINSTVPAVSGDVLRIEYIGGVLKGYVNGVLGCTWTPATPIVGNRYTGVICATSSSNGVKVLDDWSGGDAVAAPPTPTVTSRWSGNVTDTSAEVAAEIGNPPSGASIRLVAATNSGLTTGVVTGSAVTADAQNYVKIPITGLTPNTQYFYAIEFFHSSAWVRDTTQQGKFHSFPVPGSNVDFPFVHAHCHAKGFNDTVWDALAAATGNFYIQCGDLNYEDNDDATDTETARNVRRTAFRDHLTSSRVKTFYGTRSMVYTWDDHDSCGNNSDRTNVGFPNAAKVYRQVVPHYPLSASDNIGIWQDFVYGEYHFIILDSRSQRDPIADTDNASKSMLGDEQKQWLKDTMLNSSSKYYVIVSAVTWNEHVTNSDAWGRYQTEQDELIAWWTANGMINSILVVSGDMHGTAADDGTNSPGGIPIVIGGAVSSAGSTKGGPYSHASIEGNRRFGHIDLADNAVSFKAYDHPLSTTTVLATMDVSLAARAVGPSIGVWNGSVVVPASAGVWNGSSVIPATVSIHS